MTTPTPTPPSPSRPPEPNPLVDGSVLGAGVAMALLLFGMVNYLAIRHYERFDWTASKVYTLSEKSRAVATDIRQPIELVSFLDPAAEVHAQVDELLDRYAAANPTYLRKRVVDPARDLLAAQRLVDQLGIKNPDVVVLALLADDGTVADKRVIDERDLAEYDYSGVQFGQGPSMEAFKGEQLITSNLLALVEAKKPRVLFTVGHGEARLDPGDGRALSAAQDLLGKDNFDIDTWSLLGDTEIPADTDLLVIAGPQTTFLQPELDALSRYLDAGGRMLLMVDPDLDSVAEDSSVAGDSSMAAGSSVTDSAVAESTDPSASGLDQWLRGYGVALGDDLVIDPQNPLPFYGAETIYTDSYGFHPIVEALEQTRTPTLMPLARSIGRVDADTGDAGPATTGPAVTELVRTSAAGWAETDLGRLDAIDLDDADRPGPISLGVAVELGPEDAGRLVVFGDLDFATDAHLGNGANGILLLNAFNWLVKREKLIDIEARRPAQTRLELSRGELINVYLLVLLVQPALALLVGFWVYRTRRR